MSKITGYLIRYLKEKNYWLFDSQLATQLNASHEGHRDCWKSKILLVQMLSTTYMPLSVIFDNAGKKKYHTLLDSTCTM
jgi:hypothetical protein